MPLIEYSTCPQCSTELSPEMVVCPGCSRLIHSDELNRLAAAARDATEQGDLSTALSCWRDALELLPANSRQWQLVVAKIDELSQLVSSGATSNEISSNEASSANGSSDRPSKTPGNANSKGAGAASGLGILGYMLFKLKLLFHLKLLLLGLTKISTVFSMLVAVAAYCALWGWQFALGVVLSIYVHEMGHVIALRRYGFKASAPMFIPFLGAFIRLYQQVTNPLEDAEIGLAGPIYGLAAALFSLSLWYATNLKIFAAIAGFGGYVNLFNLLPIGSLDGGRGFHAMDRWQKLYATAAALAAWYILQDGLPIVLAIVCAFRALGDPAKATIKGSWKITFLYGMLVVALAAITSLRPILGK